LLGVHSEPKETTMSKQMIKDKVQDRLAELKTLRDEIGLDLQLASMELRDEWKDMERKLPDPAVAAEHLKDFTTDAIERLSTQLRTFRARLRQKAHDGQVARIMSATVATCMPSDSLAAAVTTMWDRDVGCLPVVGDGGQVLGIITDRDAAIAACTRGRRMDDISVESVMSREVVSCKPEDGVEQALALMRSHKVRRLPVITEAGALVGLVTVNDAARSLAAQLEGRARPTGPAEIAVTLATIAEPKPSRAAPAN
jgi:CBS-domain-containing membrane protein